MAFTRQRRPLPDVARDAPAGIALPLFAHAAPPQDQWFTVLLDGRKIGSFESKREPDGERVVTTQKLDLVLDRAGIRVALASSEASTETKDGVPLGFRSVSQLSGSETVIDGSVHGDTIQISSRGAGTDAAQRQMTWPKGALLPEGLRLAGIRAGACKHHDAIGDAAERHPGLGAVEAPTIAIAHRIGADACDVGAVVGLGDGGRRNDVAAENFGDQRLVRIGAVMVEEQHGFDRDREGVGDRAGAARQLLHRNAGCDRIEPGAARAFAQADAEQAEIGHAFVQRAVEAIFTIDCRRARQDLGFREAAGGLAQVLPQIIDQFTPNGQVPHNGDDIVAQALSMLNKRTA